MSVPFKNIYHLRHVAETAQKPCIICYKPTNAVLVSEDGKNDFFYTCKVHLTDSGFAIPVTNPAAEAAKRKQAALALEIEKVKKEWEKKQGNRKTERERKEKERSKEKERDKKKEAEDDKAENTLDKRDKAEHKEQLAKLETQKEEAEKEAAAEVRIFNLNKAIYAMRINNWRNIQRSKKTAELLRKPGGLPSVPSSLPGTPKPAEDED
ncbi:VPS4-associated protein 1 [Myxozyma melibiosi]|uniref:VPS4-associated protein 1 n=1 Tax=Myxozyma melibiosi TaxID=54550 RepID=A0ABR1F6J8_9ASCO